MTYNYSKKQRIGVQPAQGALVVCPDIRKVRVEDGGLFLYSGANAATPDYSFSLVHVAHWSEALEPETPVQTDGSGNPIS